MRVIVTGGRNYSWSSVDDAALDHYHANYHFTELVHGGATGAETGARIWAERRGVPATVMHAEWAKYGNRGTKLRNTAMAQYVGKEGMVIVFPGGGGTLNMVQKARAMGMAVVYARKGV
jgi:YspA, cpYpsA-related SLOG family